MEATKTIEAPRRAFGDQDETHEAALRIAREREERDRRLREVARSRVSASHELHVSIGS